VNDQRISEGFRHYLALGDSISIDRYPAFDVQEREQLAHPPPGLGAASLLYRNDNERWPGFAGRDLRTHFPDLQRLDLTVDGATTRSTTSLIPLIPADLEGPVLVTLTAGGNDLLGLLRLDLGRPATMPKGEGEKGVDDVARALEWIVYELRDGIADPTILVGTVYDPSDGTGNLGDGVVRERALRWLARFNAHVKALAEPPAVRVVPIHDHFLGHGLSEPDPDARWYWQHMIIEPSAQGASEVRRLWLESLGL